MCGEQLSFHILPLHFQGSPPRVRGTEYFAAVIASHIRITPACAGNRGHGVRLFRAGGDHPRVCGEQLCLLAGITVCTGSPPRVRGTENRGFICLIYKRITPACAGNSDMSISRYCLRRDHPRVCGEQSSPFPYCTHGIGSPPRVRGTAFSFSLAAFDVRITPACAGNSPPRWAWSATPQDHPRVCGEQHGSLCCFPAIRGSPPRVRGTAAGILKFPLSRGITPACAGNSMLQ